MGYSRSQATLAPMLPELILSLALSPAALAPGAPGAAGVAAAAPASLDEILVVGEQPRPAMWKITSGDHALYILATLEPLPKRMVWRSKAVEDRIAMSQLVIEPPSVSAHIGFFRSLSLVPSLLHARHAPDGKSLEQSLPHDVYIRWLALRVKFMGNHADETMRPLFAAIDLYSHAIDTEGLTYDSNVWDRVSGIAKSQHVPVQAVKVEVPVDDPKQYIRDLSTIPPGREVACLDSTMQQLETGLPEMRSRANLWATGDIEKLKSEKTFGNPDLCVDAVTVVPSLHAEFEKIKAQTSSDWLRAVDVALHANMSTLAVLPIGEFLGADGMLEQLRAKGYEVIEP
jgi:uncharacterized protein YbaP (TraB family)